MKVIKNILILIGLLMAGSLWGANEVSISIVQTGPKTIVVRMCANTNINTNALGQRSWTTLHVYLRFVPSVSAPFIAGASQITGNNTDGFAGYEVTDELIGDASAVTLFPLTNLNGSMGTCVDDGNFYAHLQDGTSSAGVLSSPLNAGDCVDLFTMTFPAGFDCVDCVQLVTGDLACSDLAIETPRAGNAKPGWSSNVSGDTEQNLPIELLRFEPRTNKCDVSLYWETASEKNFGYFQIEASKDGREFRAVEQKKPQSPNSSSLRTYKYPVPVAYQGYYFRLKSVDLDGAFEYSKIVYTESPCKKDYQVQLYPNPNYLSELTVEVNSPESREQVQVFLVDNFGKRIRE